MRKITITIGLLLSLINLAVAQTILQDKSGAGTFTLGGQLVSINAGDASVTGSLGESKTLDSHKKFWNVNIKFKSTDGISSLFDGAKLKPTIDLGGYYGENFGKSNWSWFAGGKVSSSFFNLLKGDKSNTYNDRVFIGPTLTYGLNQLGSVAFLSKTGKKSNYILGITGNIAVINNLLDLKSVEVYQATTVTQNDTSKTLLQDKKSGFSGDYHTSAAALINIDFFLYPNLFGDQIAIGGYARTQLFGYQPRQNGGIGVLIGGKGAPTNIVFGLLYQFNDIFNQLGKENDFLKRGGINLVAGYKF